MIAERKKEQQQSHYTHMNSTHRGATRTVSASVTGSSGNAAEHMTSYVPHSSVISLLDLSTSGRTIGR